MIKNKTKVKLNLKPIYNKDSKVLILGSMPSVISREKEFYYYNKNNRFWKILNILFNKTLITKEEKTNFLLNKHIALYDIIQECYITNSSDSSITCIKLTNIEKIINNSKIKYIFCLGRLTYNLYNKNFTYLNLNYYYLPSPSSANASYSLEKLIIEYNIIKEKLDN